MNALAVEYGNLLEETKPEVIHGEEENRRTIELLESLTAKEQPTEAEKKLIDLLTVRQKDLAEVFGTESIVSDVLNGKRELNKDHIKRLSERFHVSPEVFF